MILFIQMIPYTKPIDSITYDYPDTCNLLLTFSLLSFDILFFLIACIYFLFFFSKIPFTTSIVNFSLNTSNTPPYIAKNVHPELISTLKLLHLT